MSLPKMLIVLQVFVCWILWTCIAEVSAEKDCNHLLVGQYLCEKPVINNETQEIDGCFPNGTAKIRCQVHPKIHCKGDFDNSSNRTYFKKSIPCRYTNGYSYMIAVLLSLFLGWLGVDRFYLGYPAIGLVKFCTFGVCGIGAFVDFFLITLQIILPSDGSNYVIDYYGPRLQHLFVTNETYYKPVPD